ncbi:MAG: dephospho-CoA kinase, partial [Acidimicrobiia bacterium]|nr:dephospho-CoA kinase [Acidimicrobiia bacterium]
MSDLGNGDGGSRLSRVVVTGPIGSGKSVVAALLRQRGATVIDADTLGHAVLGPGGEAFGAVAARWPSVVVDGGIDRSRLAALVFADRTQLEVLQALTHPAIVARIEAAVGDADEVVAVEMPLLDPTLRWHRLV